MNIGDLYFGFRGADDGLMLDAKKSGAAAGLAGGKSFSYKFGESMRSGLGIGAGIGMFNLLSGAISGTVDWLAKGVQGARDEAAGMARLTQSLRQNVDGWDGNTEAIEKQVRASAQLGFADDELRDSLARLVGATHDVNAAFNLQRTAMDLARFKKIDLAEATDALIKVEGGQYKMLKGLGIVLKKGATQTEALAAVQKVAGGQAATYMKEGAGKAELLAQKMDDLGESIGAVAVGPLADITSGLSQLVDELTGTAEGVADLNWGFDGWEALDAITFDILNLDRKTQIMKDNTTAAAGEAAKAWDTGSERIGAALGTVQVALGETGEASGDTKDDIVADNRQIKRSYKDTASYLLDQYTGNFDTALGIVDARADLSANKAEAAALRKRIASGKLTAKEIADAKARIRELDIESADRYAKLAEMGALSASEYDAWLAVVEKLAKGTKGKVHEAYVAAIRDIRALKAAASGNIKVSVTYKSPKPGQAAVPQAAGGAYRAGRLHLVGEEGPEFRVESSSGYTLSHADSMAAVASAFGAPAAGPGSGSTIVVMLPDGRVLGEAAAPYVTAWQQSRLLLKRA